MTERKFTVDFVSDDEDGAARPGQEQAEPFASEPLQYEKGWENPAWLSTLAGRWKAFYSKNRHAVIYGVCGFLLVFLFLTVGFWKTLLFAVFIAAGVVYGQYRDGNPKMARFFAKLFGKRRR